MMNVVDRGKVGMGELLSARYGAGHFVLHLGFLYCTWVSPAPDLQELACETYLPNAGRNSGKAPLPM